MLGEKKKIQDSIRLFNFPSTVISQMSNNLGSGFKSNFVNVVADYLSMKTVRIHSSPGPVSSSAHTCSTVFFVFSSRIVFFFF